MRRVSRVLVYVAVGTWLAGALAACPDRPTAPYPVSDPTAVVDDSLGPGDVFEVRVFDEPRLSSTYTVPREGAVNFLRIGELPVAGKTAKELEQEITARLADGYLKNPSVSVRVLETRSKKVSVFGQVRAPGTFAFTENMSIVELVSRAGGFTAMARKNSVRVVRKTADGKAQRIEVAVEDIGQGKAPNFLLRPGDVVFVPERTF